jgi:hypothetical protein
MADAELRRLADAVSQLSQQLGQAGKSASKSEDAIGSLSGKFAKAAKEGTLFATAIKTVGVSLATHLTLSNVISKVAAFNTSLFEVSRTAKFAGQSFSEMSKVISDLSATTVLSSQQSAKFVSMFQTGIKGFKLGAEDVKKFSSVMINEYAGSVGAATEALQDLISIQQQDIQVFDRLKKGMSGDEMIAYVSMLRNTGRATEAQIQTFMRAESAARLSGESYDEQEKKLKELGEAQASLSKFTNELVLAFAPLAQTLSPVVKEIASLATSVTSFLQGSPGLVKWATVGGVALLGLGKAYGIAAAGAKGLQGAGSVASGAIAGLAKGGVKGAISGAIGGLTGGAAGGNVVPVKVVGWEVPGMAAPGGGGGGGLLDMLGGGGKGGKEAGGMFGKLGGTVGKLAGTFGKVAGVAAKFAGPLYLAYGAVKNLVSEDAHQETVSKWQKEGFSLGNIFGAIMDPGGALMSGIKVGISKLTGTGGTAAVPGAATKEDKETAEKARNEKIAKELQLRQQISHFMEDQKKASEAIAQTAAVQVEYLTKYTGNIREAGRAYDEQITALRKSLVLSEKRLEMEKETSEKEIARLENALRLEKSEEERLKLQNSLAMQSENIRKIEGDILNQKLRIRKTELEKAAAVYGPELDARKAAVSLAKSELELSKSTFAGLSSQLGLTMKVHSELDSVVEVLKEQLAVTRKAIKDGKAAPEDRAKVLRLEQEIMDTQREQIDLAKNLREGYLSAITSMTNVEGAFSKIITRREQGMGIMLREMKASASLGAGGTGGLKKPFRRITKDGMEMASPEELQQLLNERGVPELGRLSRVTPSSVVGGLAPAVREAATREQGITSGRAAVGTGAIQSSGETEAINKLHENLPSIIEKAIEGSGAPGTAGPKGSSGTGGERTQEERDREFLESMRKQGITYLGVMPSNRPSEEDQKIFDERLYPKKLSPEQEATRKNAQEMGGLFFATAKEIIENDKKTAKGQSDRDNKLIGQGKKQIENQARQIEVSSDPFKETPEEKTKIDKLEKDRAEFHRYMQENKLGGRDLTTGIFARRGGGGGRAGPAAPGLQVQGAPAQAMPKAPPDNFVRAINRAVGKSNLARGLPAYYDGKKIMPNTDQAKEFLAGKPVTGGQEPSGKDFFTDLAEKHKARRAAEEGKKKPSSNAGFLDQNRLDELRIEREKEKERKKKEIIGEEGPQGAQGAQGVSGAKSSTKDEYDYGYGSMSMTGGGGEGAGGAAGGGAGRKAEGVPGQLPASGKGQPDNFVRAINRAVGKSNLARGLPAYYDGQKIMPTKEPIAEQQAKLEKGIDMVAENTKQGNKILEGTRQDNKQVAEKFGLGSTGSTPMNLLGSSLFGRGGWAGLGGGGAMGLDMGKGVTDFGMAGALGVGMNPETFSQGLFGFAKGGRVTKAGSTDSIPALLSPGEFVMKSDSARRFAPILRAMNENKYALGGFVGPSPSMARSGGGGFSPRINMNVRGDSVNKILKSVNNRLASQLTKMMVPYGTTGRAYEFIQ